MGFRLVPVVLLALLMIGLQTFVHNSKPGKAMRAASEDYATAQLMGINVNNIISLTFAIGSALAAIGAYLYVMAYPAVSPTMGSLPGLKAFIAAVVGGIGNIRGAMIGGFILGIVEIMVAAFMPSTYRDFVAFGVLLILLIFRPYGILGKPRPQKV